MATGVLLCRPPLADLLSYRQADGTKVLGPLAVFLKEKWAAKHEDEFVEYLEENHLFNPFSRVHGPPAEPHNTNTHETIRRPF